MVTLKRPQAGRSSGLKAHMVTKYMEKSFPTLKELLVLVKIILHSPISFALIRSIDFAAYTRSLIALSKATLKSKKWDG